MHNDVFPLKNPPLAALLTFVLPGLGHWYQGRKGKGILLGGCVLSLFLLGWGMGQWRNVYFRWTDDEWTLAYFGQVGIGVLALPALITDVPLRQKLPAFLGDFQAAPSPDELHRLHFRLGRAWDIAVVYTVIAGLLNVLIMLDAFYGPALLEEERRMLAGEPA